MMMLMEKARELAIGLSEGNEVPRFINRYFYHNPSTKQSEVWYVVERRTTTGRLVEAYINGEKVDLQFHRVGNNRKSGA